MNPSKAIRNLGHTHDRLQSVLSTEDLEAIQMGIEALKGRQQMIACGWKLLPPLLPGETKH